MKRDPQIRSYDDAPPLMPFSPMRFEWPDAFDPDVARIRAEVQEGAPGLYVLRAPGGRKVLAEAYYPEGIRSAFYETELDPFRRADYQDGRLVVVNVLFAYSGELDGRRIDEIRRNNRAAQDDLKRQSSAYDRRLELRSDREQQEMNIPEVREFFDAYEDGVKETLKSMKPRNTSTQRIA